MKDPRTEFAHPYFALGILVAAVGCRAPSDATALENPWSTKDHGVPSAMCQEFCANATCEPLDNCALRCDWLRDLGWQIGAELDSECGEALELNLACATVTGCVDSHAADASCSVEMMAESLACGGQPLYYLGWESCHRYCDAAIACPGVPFTGWHDCFGECKGNALLDQVASCSDDGIALRLCYSTGNTCEEIR